ncbi:MAG TPA: hypothetical protein PLO23_01270 [Alphaproteobacteria bacterium]|nr:hypothetical protein [Alphaproteobacteria bacterium]
MKLFKFIAVLLPVLAASCLSDDEPQRPKLAYTPHYANEGFAMAHRPITDEPTMAATTTTLGPQDVAAIEPAAGLGFVRNDTYQQESATAPTAMGADKIPSGCSIKDRFDRTETIAYQWGQNRIGFNYDTSGTDFKGAFIKYRLKFQPHKTSKERCKYPARWQGLLGSAHNEFFLRENNTVWDDLKTIRLDAESRLDTLLQR